MLLAFNLVWREWLSAFQFGELWLKACAYNLENLLTEVVLRGDLELEDPPSAYVQIGDFGGRRLLYYAKLESELESRCSVAKVAYEGQQPTLLADELSSQIGSTLPSWERTGAFQQWRSNLAMLHPYLVDLLWLNCMVEHVKNRQVDSKLTDVHPASYVAAYYLAKDRVEAKRAARDPTQVIPFKGLSEVLLSNLQLGPMRSQIAQEFPELESWTVPQALQTRFGDDYYLGKWDNLFHKKEDAPFPTWDAIVWIGKDHGLDVRPPPSLLASGRYIGRHTKNDLAPPQVRQDPRFCATTIRRYPWYKDQQLDTIWYNFCLMEGEYDT